MCGIMVGGVGLCVGALGRCGYVLGAWWARVCERGLGVPVVHESLERHVVAVSGASPIV